MISEANARTSLNEIANKAKIEQDDVLVLGAIIYQLFSDRSPIATTFDKLNHKRIGDTGPLGGPPRTAPPSLLDEDFRHLARSASRLIDLPKSPDQSDPKGFEEKVAQLVDHSFYKSQPFSFAKWMLLVSLLAVLGGSASYAGFSIAMWSRAQDARDQLAAATEKYNATIKDITQKGEDLQRLQAQTIANIQKTIEEKAGQWENELTTAVETSKTALTEKIRAAETFIEGQKGTVTNSVAAAGTVIEDQKTKFATDIAAANLMIEGQKNKVSADVASANTHIEAQKRSFASNLDAASSAVDEQKNKFTAVLALLLEQTRGKVDAAVTENLLVVKKAGENGAQTISGDVQRRLDAITREFEAAQVGMNQAAERKKADLEIASANDIRTLKVELNKKLAELDERSRDAGQAIDTVAKSLAARESSFVSGMNGRLAEWDQRVSLELKRVDDVAKSAASLEVRTKGLGAQIEALLGSFKAALDVAHELRSGTTTGELPLIGKVLEKSAALFIASLAIALFGAFVSLFTLLVPFRVGLYPRRPRDRGIKAP